VGARRGGWRQTNERVQQAVEWLGDPLSRRYRWFPGLSERSTQPRRSSSTALTSTAPRASTHTASSSERATHEFVATQAVSPIGKRRAIHSRGAHSTRRPIDHSTNGHDHEHRHPRCKHRQGRTGHGASGRKRSSPTGDPTFAGTEQASSDWRRITASASDACA
jgi:hypothetical protein